jgi:hypothetical protein
VGAERSDLSAEIGEILGRAGVNIDGTFGSRRLGEIHILVEDPAALGERSKRRGWTSAGSARFSSGTCRSSTSLDPGAGSPAG